MAPRGVLDGFYVGAITGITFIIGILYSLGGTDPNSITQLLDSTDANDSIIVSLIFVKL